MAEEKTIWRCSSESAEQTLFHHCNGDMQDDKWGHCYDPETKALLYTECPNPEYKMPVTGSCNIVRSFTPLSAANDYCRDFLCDQFDSGTEMEVWVRDEEDKLWHGYAQMTDCDAKDEDGNDVDPESLEYTELSEACSVTFEVYEMEPAD